MAFTGIPKVILGLCMMSMGKGAIVNVSRRHKLNVGSSTESELVRIADVLGVMLWCKYFMEAQRCTIDSNLLYQDNKSTILLAKNGRMSAGKASIHHRLCLITDKIEKGDVSVEYRETKEMWADGNAKPLQGASFSLFMSKIMGMPENYDDETERVGTHPQLLTAQAQGSWGGALSRFASVSQCFGSEG